MFKINTDPVMAKISLKGDDDKKRGVAVALSILGPVPNVDLSGVSVLAAPSN